MFNWPMTARAKYASGGARTNNPSNQVFFQRIAHNARPALARASKAIGVLIRNASGK